MTDSHIWKYIKKRFYAMSRPNEETGDIERFPFFMKCTNPESSNPDWEETNYEEFKDDNTVTLNVIEPNETASRPENSLWFEIFPLHAPPSQQELGTTGRNRWNFGLQVNINSPKDRGTYEIEEAYDFIAGNFKRGDIFNGIRVLQTASRSSARIQDDFYSVPVTIMVQADLDN